MSSYQQARVSSAIENVFTTDDDLYKALSDSKTGGDAAGPVKEVLRYREALWEGYHYLKKKGAFDRDYFIRLYQIIQESGDGNGRVGRIMNLHIITRSHKLELPILYLSRYILEHKQAYYEHLAGVSQRGNWKAWLLYMLKAVEWTSQFTLRKVNDIIVAREDILDVLREQTDVRWPGGPRRGDLHPAIYQGATPGRSRGLC